MDKVKSLLTNPSHALFFSSILNCPPSAHLFSSTAKVIHSALKGDVVVGLLAAQLCLTLCNPVDCSLAGPSVHGILQTRISERLAVSFSRGSSRLRDPTRVSCIAGNFFTVEPPGKPTDDKWGVNFYNMKSAV